MAALARIHRLVHFIAPTEIGSFTLMLVMPLMMCVVSSIFEKCWKFVFQSQSKCHLSATV
jgi:hypothetical protein